MSSHYRPIILIGAARSGTKLLRDVIALHPQVSCVPFDINYVWRMGNESLPDDELTIANLDAGIARDIRLEIGKFQCGQPVVIEKTVSNCLRVPYVRQVFPDALFIHLVRDGRDVVESTFRQWTDKPDMRYVVRKLRTFPIRKAFGYGVSYAWSLLKRLVFPGKTVATWGPRYKGIDDDVAGKPLLEVCARQWVYSVARASADLASLPAEQVFTVRYEDFVLDPLHYLHEIADFIGVDKALFSATAVNEIVSPQNIGKGFSRLTAAQQAVVLPVINNELIRLNYSVRDKHDA